MPKYYTRACNFYFGQTSKEKVKKKNSLPLNGDSSISFDMIELITRKSSRKLRIFEIKKIKGKIKNKILSDLKKISKKKKIKNLNFKNLPILMGVLNLTPDSFSDGGKYIKSKNGLLHAKKLINDGCGILDVGGESTRPGSKEISLSEEWKRLHPTLSKIKKLKKFISLDTRKSYIMEKGIKNKINLINDISGLEHDVKTLKLLKKTKVPFVIHHIQGNPATMQNNPKYKNVILDIYDFFENKIKYLRSMGIKHNNIILDPGIGFWVKT